VEAGNGDPVVLLHGSGPGACGWLGWRETIPALAKHYHVYALDVLGFGYTDKPTNMVYSDQATINHMAAFIDVLCLTKVRLAGSSKGAYMAAKYACDHPSRVLAVLMVSSGSIASAMGIERTPDEMMGQKALNSYDGTPAAMRKWMQFIVNDHSRITDDLVASRVALAALPGQDNAIKSASAYRKTLHTDSNERQLFDLQHRLPMLTIPMHMVWGAKDNFAPPGFAERLKGKLPNVTFEMLERSGHQAQNDESERFNEIALRFFERAQ
jgi:pimeloyl-ACP methyl ester carboxylesterase